jgi:C4-dicarboxylate transporter, DctM subunit
MSPETIGLIGVLLLLVVLAFGVAGLAVLISPEAALIKTGVIAFDAVSRYELGVLPLFLLMAHLCFAAGASRDFYDSAAKFIGHRRGGLAIASIGGCAGFGAISGSSLATVATMGLTALPEMRKYNYAPSLATGALAAGGTLGSITPPSAALIVFGILAEESIGRLFTAAIGPAITQALFYMLLIAALCRINPALGPPTERQPWSARLASLVRLIDIGALVLVVLGGIALGWFSPTEAASVGAVGATIICALRRALTRATIVKAVTDTLRTTGMIYAIIIGAMVFSTFVSATGFGDLVVEWVAGLNAGRIGILVAFVVLMLILGTFLDGLALMTLTIPIFLPIIQHAGIDVILFGILMVRTMEIGFLTPPVGMNVYVIHNMARDVPLSTVLKGVTPFFLIDLVHVGVLIAFPAIALFLPDLLGA